jgi:small RNA 2'-O-methyltransferase
MRPSNSEDPDDLEAIPSSTEDNSLDFARLSDGADEPFPEAVDSEEEAGPNFEASVVKIDDDFFGDEEEPLFSPPLYVQRYCAVERIIDGFAQTSCIKSLADLGCAELKFIVRAKNGKQFQRIIGVDRDEFLVGSHCRRIQPGVFEMINKRDQPLTIEVYAGDATEPDQRLLDVDVVTAIELIEHMEPEIHAALAAAVFGVMQPQLAIFTTPNVEYNPLFPGGSVDLRRHWDHRFEWTRAEFQAW